MGNLQVRFLEGWAPAMAPGYSTLEQVLGVLFSEGLVGLERVTQDGTKIRAQACASISSKVLISPNDTWQAWMRITSIHYLNTKRPLATASSVSAKQDSSPHCSAKNPSVCVNGCSPMA